MAKFAIECPKCGAVSSAPSFPFFKKAIRCGSCGYEIDIKASKMATLSCSCGNIFVCDASRKSTQKCPVCGKDFRNTGFSASGSKIKMVNCPQCACAVPVDTLKLEKDPNVDCPVCGNRFDAKREIAKQKLVNDIGISVIQFEGDNNIFVWKHPIEDFNLGTQLIVHESQEAVFFLGGEIMDTFSAGKYTLETESIPILKKIYDIPSGSQTPFHSEVYFINKAVQMPLKWGTDTRVRFIDPLTGIPLDIGASREIFFS